MAIVADGIMGGDGETSESCLFPASWPGRSASFFFGVRIRLGTILGRFSIIYFMGLWLRIRVRVWVWVCGRVRVMVRVRVSVVLWSG